MHSMTPMAQSSKKPQSNLKQLGTGLSMYAQDYEEASPSASAPAAPSYLVSNLAKRKTRMPADTGFVAGRQRQQIVDGPVADLNGNAKAETGESRARMDAVENYMTVSRAGKAAAAIPAHGTVSKLPSIQQQLANLAGEEQAERTVHRDASETVQVDNVETRSETVAQYAQTAGGFVSNNQLSTGEDDVKTANLTLKVPVAQFETVLNQVARLGEVKAKNVNGEDLTEQISDQEQSEHILRQDINTTQDELTHRLTRSGRQERLDTLRELRTRIAQTTARLKLLHKLGALSTISVELDEKPHTAPPAPKTGGFLDDMNNALHGAMSSMAQAARLPILTFIWILAYSPLWLLLIMGYRYAVRR
jgi:hypothetical protein